MEPRKYQSKKYLTTYPDVLRRRMAAGFTKASFCSEMKICEKTFENWVNNIPEFGEAYAEGKMHKKAYYEKFLKDNIFNKKVNPILAKYLLEHVAGMRCEKKDSHMAFTPVSPETEELIKIWQEKHKSDV